MKRITIILLLFAVVMSLVSCGGNSNNNGEKDEAWSGYGDPDKPLRDGKPIGENKFLFCDTQGIEPVKETEKLKSVSNLTKMLSSASVLPVSFRLDGKLYNGLTGADFSINRDGNRFIAEHKDSGLVITVDYSLDNGRCCGSWSMTFENRGDTVSPVVSDVKVFSWRSNLTDPQLRWNNSYVDGGAIYYEERGIPLRSGTEISFSPSMSDDGTSLPYFVMSWKNAAFMIAVGWQGIWEASFSGVSYVNATDVGIVAGIGQKDLSTALDPGEKLISPTVTVFEGESADRVTDLYCLWASECLPVSDKEYDMSGDEYSGNLTDAAYDQWEKDASGKTGMNENTYVNALYEHYKELFSSSSDAVLCLKGKQLWRADVMLRQFRTSMKAG